MGDAVPVPAPFCRL